MPSMKANITVVKTVKDVPYMLKAPYMKYDCRKKFEKSTKFCISQENENNAIKHSTNSFRTRIIGRASIPI
ncbi:MAG: hypothetical protein LBE76_05510 [Nitrososphaerota archaeon]|nr:hypothetical protein [Nitrososphaerota archaeon]